MGTESKHKSAHQTRTFSKYPEHVVYLDKGNETCSSPMSPCWPTRRSDKIFPNLAKRFYYIMVPIDNNILTPSASNEAQNVTNVESTSHKGKQFTLATMLVALAFSAVQAGTMLFALLILIVLVTTPWTILSYHMAGASLLVIAVTQGIFVLQPTHTPREKEKGLKYHAIIQITGITLGILGVIAGILYNLTLTVKSTILSTHGIFGFLTFAALVIQVVFGFVIAFVPTIFGGVSQAKALWKYHRVSGYTFLILVWTTTLIGVHAAYFIVKFPAPSLLWLHWLALVMVMIGIIFRVDIGKWGLKKRHP